MIVMDWNDEELEYVSSGLVVQVWFPFQMKLLSFLLECLYDYLWKSCPLLFF